MHTKYVKIVLGKLETFIRQYINAQLSAFLQKKIQRLFEKDFFKVVASNKVVILEDVPSSTQVFNSCFIDKIKNLYINIAYKENRLIMQAYKNEDKNLKLTQLTKI